MNLVWRSAAVQSGLTAILALGLWLTTASCGAPTNTAGPPAERTAREAEFPTGFRLLYIWSSDPFVPGAEDIYYVDSFSSVPQPLGVGPLRNFTPNCHPDGKRVAFSSDRSGTCDVYVLDVPRKTVQRLTTDPTEEYNPVWISDTRIAYIQQGHGDYSIVTQDTVTGKRKRVTSDGDPKSDLKWSSGNLFCIVAKEGERRVASIGLETGRRTFLSPRSLRCDSFDVEGERMALAGTNDGRSELIITSLNAYSPKQVVESEHRVDSVFFLPGGRSLFYTEWTDSGPVSKWVDLRGGDAVELPASLGPLICVTYCRSPVANGGADVDPGANRGGL